MPSLDTTRLETFVLARLLVRPKSGIGPSDVRQQLFPFVSHTLTDAAWRARLDEVLAGLRSAELVRGDALALTAKGEKEALKRLSLAKKPKQSSWPAFLAETVVPAAMGVNPEEIHVKTSDDLVALLLARHFDLPIKGKPSLPRVLNAMVWRALGEESDERLTGGALQRAVLRPQLGGTRVKEPERLARILAAKLSGARAAGAQSSRQAILRDWLAGDPPKKTPPPDRAGDDAMRIETFAAAALSAARDPTTVRFGSHKAFIDSVFERFSSGIDRPAMELPTFKNKLVAAHRKGLLTLARADLVEAMDPERVAASETRYLNTTFHFVEAD